MTQHNWAPKHPRGLLACSKSSLSSSHWQAGSQTDYGHTSRVGLHNPTVLWPSASPREKELMGEQQWAWVPLHSAAAQARSDPIPTAEKTIFSCGDHMLRMLFSPFIPWKDVAVACGETLFSIYIWYLRYKYTDARNKKQYTKEGRKTKLNKPRKK